MALTLLAVGLAFTTAAAAGDGDLVCEAGACGETGGVVGQDFNPEGYYWRRRGGGINGTASTPHTAPTNFSRGPAWAWPNELDEQVRHSPLIDDKSDIYVATAIRIRKFDPSGKLKWTWEVPFAEGKMSTSPALYHGTIYALSMAQPSAVHMHAVDMETGRGLWKTTVPGFMHPDANSLLVYNDTIFFPLRDHVEDQPMIYGDDGNNQVRAMNATDGRALWEYTLDDIVWNMIVSTPGDGTILLSSTCGRVYRLSWAGELIWQAGREPMKGLWCGCAGGILGPNGLFYAEFNDWPRFQGVLAAHRVSDGSVVWERTFPLLAYGGWQYPSVGRIAPSGRLAVVAALGGITNVVKYPGISWLEHDSVPFWIKDFFFRRLYLGSAWVRRQMGVPPLANAVAAFDAETGETIWWAEEAPWDHFAMAGDEERYVERTLRKWANPTREDDICLPDPQGIPLIAGDGTVYVSSSHTGDLFAVRDDNGDGTIAETEVSIFQTGNGFLNSPSLAPGMLVAAPCWGPVYVFKDAAAR